MRLNGKRAYGTALLCLSLIVLSCSSAPRIPFQKENYTLTDKALIYVYSPKFLMNFVQIGPISALFFGSKKYYPYLSSDRNPFIQVQTHAGRRIENIKLDITLGKTHYVKITRKAGMIQGKYFADIVPPELAEKEIANCALATPLYDKIKTVESVNTTTASLLSQKKALIYIYRPKVLTGAVVKYINGLLSYGEKPNNGLVYLPYGGFQKWYVPPGEFGCNMIFGYPWEIDNDSAAYRFDVQAGHTYYIRTVPHHIDVVNQVQANKEMADCRLGQVINKYDKAAIDDLLSKKGKIGLVWIDTTSNPTARLYKITGSAGILDYLIFEVTTSELKDRLEKEKTQTYIEKFFIANFRKEFSSAGLTVNTMKDAYHRSDLVKLDEGFEDPPYDFKPLANRLEVDYLVVLDVLKFGIESKNKDFPLRPISKASALVTGYIVEGSTNNMLTKFTLSRNMRYSNNWNVPPEYHGLTNSIKLCIRDAINDFYCTLFGKRF